MLVDMGFTSAQAKKALRETVSCAFPLVFLSQNHIGLIEIAQSGNAERAVEWLFSHPDDMGEDAAPTASSTSTATDATTAQLPGTTDVPVKYRLKAFISHKGPSVHSGHYVAHIRVNDSEGGKTANAGAGVDEGWVLFNDEKVVKADGESVRELKKLAYLYVFERV